MGGYYFTIRTDHRNLLFMNNLGSRKVLQWKSNTQHYDATIEHVAGKANIPADEFSWLIIRPQPVVLNHVLYQYYSAPRHNETCATRNEPHLRLEVRQFVRSCPTCQKMDTRHKIIRASRFILSTLKPMVRISIDKVPYF